MTYLLFAVYFLSVRYGSVRHTGDFCVSASVARRDGAHDEEEAAAMGIRAKGGFEIEDWEEEPYDEREGAKLARAHLTKTFHGDTEGESTTDLLLAYAQEGSAAYVGLERFVGRVHGRQGSFVLHHSASGDRETSEQVATVSVVPNSATGELRGLRGTAQIVVGPDGGHTFTLDYDFE